MNKARVIACWGARGSGKSTRALELAEAAPRLLVFDVLHNTTVRGAIVVKELGAVRLRIAAGAARGYRIVYRPPLGALKEALSECSRLVLALQRAGGKRFGPIVFYVEEMSLCFPEEKLPATCQGFTELCLVGRHDLIGVIGVAQRPSQVGKAFVGNTDESYVFRPNGPRDLATSEEILGSGHAATIRALVNFAYIHKDHTTGIVRHQKARKH